MTLMGPHRDDFAIAIDGRDGGAYASRGQQRLAVLAMKLAEAVPGSYSYKIEGVTADSCLKPHRRCNLSC